MPGVTTVVYPQGTTFNKDYYQKSHMPLVQEKWAKYGLKSWEVIYFNDDAQYCVQATLRWSDVDDFKGAADGPEAKEVLGDIPNFSNNDPIILAGEVAYAS